ncbi:hypothetical protein DASC09_028020 [Saccharomycopsis crataegensis]|uniref:Flavin-containing monooxygenase n=1 Tax=Saccharomycopsis crataegensis TaxID=43959 RepID=A0AAV5QLI4_9ASCO|nr:hypothetical protein DASC09_028020 [Saccharomycopsis crataegensis]
MTLPKRIKRVAVIGAGPAGAGFAKALVQEKFFDNITLFERRWQTGGLWNYSKDQSNDRSLLSVPSENPFLSPTNCKDSPVSPYEIPLKKNDSSSSSQYVWPSAVYEELDTNIPKELMAYNKYPFDKKLPLYPSHRDVLNYLCNYSKDIEPLVRFNTKVVNIEFINGYHEDDTTTTTSQQSFVDAVKCGKIKHLQDIDWSNYSWKITSRPIVDATKGGTEPDLTPDSPYADKIEYFDGVAMASGNYDVPYTPDFPGLAEWNAKFPNSVTHAKFYNNFQDYTTDDKILVVGNSASGADIAYQLAIRWNMAIYKSKRSENLQPAGSDSNIKDLPNIKRFIPETQEIEFVDGQKIKGFTQIIFATGYLKSLPYMNELSLPLLGNFHSTLQSIENNELQPLISTGSKVNGLYQHLLSYQYPGLAIIGTPKYVIPTRLSETQGAWISRVWSGRIPLPSIQTMQQWEKDRTLEVNQDDYKFHSIPYPADVEHYVELNDQIVESGTDYGLIPVLWDEKQRQIREYAKKIKESYIAYKKDKNLTAFSLQELEQAGYLKYEKDDK